MFQHADTLPSSSPGRPADRPVDRAAGRRTGALTGPLTTLGRQISGLTLSAAGKLLARARARRRRRLWIREMSRLTPELLSDIGLDPTAVKRSTAGDASTWHPGGVHAPRTNFIAAVLAQARAQTPAVARTRHDDPRVFRSYRPQRILRGTRQS